MPPLPRPQGRSSLQLQTNRKKETKGNKKKSPNKGNSGKKGGANARGGPARGIKQWNNDAHPKVKALIEQLKLKGRRTAPRSIFRAAMKRNPDFRSWPGEKEGDPIWCPEWTLGGCHVDDCKFVHENAPAEYIDWICVEVKPGAEAILAEPVGWRAPDMGRAGGGRRQ